MTNVRIEEVHYASVPDSELFRLNAFENAMLHEELPDDPPKPAEHTIATIRSIPKFIVVRDFWARDEHGDVVGVGYVYWFLTEENRHLGRFVLQVRADHRRSGIGRALFERMVDALDADGRTTLMGGTNDRIPAGEAFARRVGAEPNLATHMNRLVLDSLDRDLMRGWAEEGPLRAPGYSLFRADRPFSDDLIGPMADLMQVMNTAPTGDLDVEDERITPEQIRQRDAAAAAEKVEIWNLVARHDATGELAGYTEVMWTPYRPLTVSQGDTGVRPEHRGHALGKWLKGAMTLRILNERPDVKDIRTGNADSNDAMLGINHAMGFKPYVSAMWWNVTVERARAYLYRGEAPRTPPAGGSST